MRVHVGSDHAGLGFKAHLLAWLASHGHDPVDHGPFVYDDSTTTPSSACGPPRGSPTTAPGV